MKKRTNLVIGLCTGVAILALAACGSAAAPTPTSVPTVAPAPTKAPEPTATTAPAPTATPAATATKAPAPTVAPSPTTAPSPTVAATATAVVTATEAAGETKDVARPSNEGDPGPAIKLKGNVVAGAKVFVDNCKKCHGDEGKEGIDNPGSTDGTVPSLNPIDDTLIDKDPVVYATNLDLFIEHGSTPGGKSPKEVMTAFGKEKKLTPQQIADVIAYVISLNPAK